MWYSIAKSVELVPGSATLTVSCPEGGGSCIADAVLLESEARYNDGSAVSGAGVALASMDAIILARTDAPPHCGSSTVGDAMQG